MKLSQRQPVQAEFPVADEAQMLALGQTIAVAISAGVTLFLKGDLGAGKTTLCRGILQGLGYTGRVKSPTYTLVEPYEIKGRTLYHFDLYRLAEPSELEYVGYRDYFVDENICLVEWPEQAQGMLAAPDLEIQIAIQGSGRRVVCVGSSDKGFSIIKGL